MQVPSFLIVRASVATDGRILADPMYDQLLHKWLKTDSAPSAQMDEFAFSLASGLRLCIYRDEQLAIDMAGYGHRTRSWVSSLYIRIMTSWMQETPISDIAQLAAWWLKSIDAEIAINGASAFAGQDGADRRTVLAWLVVQTNAEGHSFRSAHSRAIESLASIAPADGWCGLR